MPLLLTQKVSCKLLLDFMEMYWKNLYRRSSFNQEVVSVREYKIINGNPAIFGYVFIKKSSWFLITIIKSTPYLKIPKIFRMNFL